MPAPASCPFASGFQVEQLMAAARRASAQVAHRVEPVARAPGQVTRRITLFPGEELPYRRNPHVAKVWRVEAGIGHCDVDEADVALMPLAEITIAPGILHQIENRGTGPLVLLEHRRMADTPVNDMDFHWPDLPKTATG